MSYEQSSFYRSSSSGAINGYPNTQGNYSSYESTSAIGGNGGFLGGGGGGRYQHSSSFAGLNQQGSSGTSFTNGGNYSSNNFQQRSSASTTNYPTDYQGLFQDPNPQIIRRPAANGPQTYTQRVTVRFLQPPPVPPPGPLIIKEVRPVQPPPPPPLYIRQRPPQPPVLPPLVIREAPPKMPAAVGTQVVTKMLPPLPVPPRSVIIERLPPLPPRPRDVIVERWLPYRSQQKRRVIIQRAPPAVVPKPRNIIIYYEPPKAQVVRKFQNLGVQRANPNEYIARYGTQLEDAHTLITHARQAGVIEDLSPPVDAATSFQSEGSFGGISPTSYKSSSSSSSYDVVGGVSTYSGGFESTLANLDLGNNLNNGLIGGNSNYESYSSQQAYNY